MSSFVSKLNTVRRRAGILLVSALVSVPATSTGLSAQPATKDPIFVAPVGRSAGVTAVVLTGDGGWAQLVREVAEGLAAKGISVVGVDSRALLSSPKTPDEATAAVVGAINSARARWPADRLVIVGYSRGADMAPFVATRLPKPLASQLAGIAMFGLANAASFEFHLIDLVKDTKRPTDIPIQPELAKLRGVKMVCVYGEDEDESGCRDAPPDLITKDARKGGHHFDKNADALVAHVVELLKR